MVRRFRSILLATDFSSASRPAAAAAIGLAAENGGTLWIVHAIPKVPAGISVRMYQQMGEFLRSGAEKRLRAMAEEARARGVRARTLLLRGTAPEAVRRAARTRRADLVVLGTHGRTGAVRVLLGSVAARVAASAPCAVLSVRRRPRTAALRTILFATDFSAASAPAWKAALETARAHGARLRIVHAQTPLAEGQAVRWAYAEAERDLRSSAWKRLQALQRKAREAGVRAEILLLRGAPHEAIRRAARSTKASWIVVGTHGRTGVAGALLGSVATRVMATATCPVLTVRHARRL